jgi:hypothetical protein
MNAPVARCAGPGERVERELALVDDIGWRRSGEDGVATQDEEDEDAKECRKRQSLRHEVLRVVGGSLIRRGKIVNRRTGREQWRYDETPLAFEDWRRP